MATQAYRLELKKKPTTPWKRPPDHPVLSKFKFLRMMSGDELDKWAATYKEIGLLFPIVVFVDNKGEERGENGPFPDYLLAGRNRLAMFERLGIKFPKDVKIAAGNLYGAVHRVQAIRQQGYLRLSDGGEAENWVVETDPELYVLASDVHRRQLNAEEMREAIAAYIERAPHASDRKIAEELKVSPTTVGDMRKKEGGQNVQFGQNDRLKRAKEALAENPNLSVAQLAKIADVSEGTVKNAKRKMKEGATTAPKSEPEPTPVDPEQEMKKKAERFQALVRKTFAQWTEQWAEDIGIAAVKEIIKAEAWAWLDNYIAALSRS